MIEIYEISCCNSMATGIETWAKHYEAEHWRSECCQCTNTSSAIEMQVVHATLAVDPEKGAGLEARSSVWGMALERTHACKKPQMNHVAECPAARVPCCAFSYLVQDASDRTVFWIVLWCLLPSVIWSSRPVVFAFLSFYHLPSPAFFGCVGMSYKQIISHTNTST